MVEIYTVTAERTVVPSSKRNVKRNSKIQQDTKTDGIYIDHKMGCR